MTNPPSLLRIHYSCMKVTPDTLDVACSRWKEDNYNVTVEMFTSSSNRKTIADHIIPGAVEESYNILGVPTFIDTTYDSGNSLILEPLGNTGVSGVREERTIAVKHYSDIPLTDTFFLCKINGVRLDI